MQMQQEGKASIKGAPRGYKFCGELYTADPRMVRDAKHIGNIFAVESGKFRILEMNNGWTGRAVPGEFPAATFLRVGNLRVSDAQSVRQYVIREESATN